MAVWKGMHNVIARISIIIVGIAAVSIFLGTVIGTTDILGALIFNWPLPAALELTQAFMVLIVFGSFAYTQVNKSHIRVTLLHDRVGPRTKAVFDVLVSLICFTFFSLFTWQTILLSIDSC